MKTRRKISSVSKTRVGAYLGACAAWGASHSSSHAEIIHGFFDAGQQPIPYSTVDNDGLLHPIDVAGDAYPGAGVFMFNVVASEGSLPVLNGSVLGWGYDENGDFAVNPTDLTLATTGPSIGLNWGNYPGYSGAALVRFAEGATIDGSSILTGGTTSQTTGYLFAFDETSGSESPTGGFVGHTSGFLGFAFTAAETTYTGWIRIIGIDSNYSQFSILDWAYTAGNIIAAGDGDATSSENVPEPSSLGLLAVGAVGLARYRRRRKSSEVATEATPVA